MPLTPIDVQQKTFGTALRGYDLDEVDDFLDEIVTALKDYEQRLRDAQERIATLENEMSDRGDAEGAISRALVAAQRSADAIVDDARSEADRIIDEAKSQADDIASQHEKELGDAQHEIDRFRIAIDDMRQRVRVLTDELDGSLGQMETVVGEAEEALTSLEDVSTESESGDDGELPSLEELSSIDRLPVIGEHDRDSDFEQAEAEIAATGEPEDTTYDPTLEPSYERSARPWEDD